MAEPEITLVKLGGASPAQSPRCRACGYRPVKFDRRCQQYGGRVVMRPTGARAVK